MSDSKKLVGDEVGEMTCTTTRHKMNTKTMKKNHLNEQVETEDLLKDMVISMLSTNVAEPKTYEEAVKSPKAKYWKQAMQAEVDSLLGHFTQHLEIC